MPEPIRPLSTPPAPLGEHTESDPVKIPAPVVGQLPELRAGRDTFEPAPPTEAGDTFVAELDDPAPAPWIESFSESFAIPAEADAVQVLDGLERYLDGGESRSVPRLAGPQIAGLLRTLAPMLDASQIGNLDSLSLDEEQSTALRANAFTLLYRLNGSRRVDAAGARELRQLLLHSVRLEPHTRLGRHMARLVDRPAFKDRLPPAEQTLFEKAVEARYPRHFDAIHITDEDGYQAWDYVAGHSPTDVQQRLDGLEILGSRFEPSGTSDGAELYTLTFPEPRGPNETKGIRVYVREQKTNIWEGLGKGRATVYDGHSGYGATDRKALRQAVNDRMTLPRPAFAIDGACSTFVNHEAMVRTLGDVQVVTTLDTSVYQPSSRFGTPYVSDAFNTFLVYAEGFVEGADHHTISKIITKKHVGFFYNRFPNLLVPSIEEFRNLRWRHLDGDGDGRADLIDDRFDVGLRSPEINNAQPVELADNGPVDGLDGRIAHAAVLTVDWLSPDIYFDRGSGAPAMGHHQGSDASEAIVKTAWRNSAKIRHRFVSGGLFERQPGEPLVRVKEITGPHGNPLIELSIASGLAHLPAYQLSALVAYLTPMALGDAGILVGLSEGEKKVLGVQMLSYSLLHGPGYELDFDLGAVRKSILKLVRWPEGATSFASGKSYESGSVAELRTAEETLDLWGKSHPELRRALESKDVGRPAL